MSFAGLDNCPLSVFHVSMVVRTCRWLCNDTGEKMDVSTLKIPGFLMDSMFVFALKADLGELDSSVI
jgi:hypothetical protein